MKCLIKLQHVVLLSISNHRTAAFNQLPTRWAQLTVASGTAFTALVTNPHEHKAYRAWRRSYFLLHSAPWTTECGSNACASQVSWKLYVSPMHQTWILPTSQANYYYYSSFDVYGVKDYGTYLASQDLLAKYSQWYSQSVHAMKNPSPEICTMKTKQWKGCDGK